MKELLPGHRPEHIASRAASLPEGQQVVVSCGRPGRCVLSWVMQPCSGWHTCQKGQLLQSIHVFSCLSGLRAWLRARAALLARRESQQERWVVAGIVGADSMGPGPGAKSQAMQLRASARFSSCMAACSSLDRLVDASIAVPRLLESCFGDVVTEAKMQLCPAPRSWYLCTSGHVARRSRGF